MAHHHVYLVSFNVQKLILNAVLPHVFWKFNL
jgi:hypothetical protein